MDGQPLSGGSLKTISPNSSREEQIAAINLIIARLNNQLKTQTFSDGSNKRYINGFSAGRWPGGDFGMAISKTGEDVSDVDFEDLLFAWDYTTGTQYWYDPTTGKNYMQIGILPDGVGGWLTAAIGQNVADAF